MQGREEGDREDGEGRERDGGRQGGMRTPYPTPYMYDVRTGSKINLQVQLYKFTAASALFIAAPVPL